MALRLTNTPAGRPATPDGSVPATASIAERAAACLRAGELEPYRKLFVEAGAVADAHRRYQARKALLEEGLAAAGHVRAHVLPSLLLTVAGGGLDILDQEPREPVLLNYVGVALYELGALDGAEALFKAAGRLDGQLDHLETNLEQLRRRRRKNVDFTGQLPGHVRAALRRLNARAARCAGRARPAEGLTLSLCMIVKDEEEMLPRCLEAARPAVDELIVVDTGSTDRTVEIARSFGAQVIEFPWTGSFADARNVSFEAASGDWVMYLDADEVLVAQDARRLRELTGRTWREAFYLVETNYTGDAEDGTAVTHNALRVFRNRPEYRFEGRLHEQVAHHLPSYLPERLEPTAIRVEHYGYLGVVRDAKEKSRRNIELLERQAADGKTSPFFHFNLGSEYAAAGDAGRARAEFERSWELLCDDPARGEYGFVPSLLGRLTRARRVTGDQGGARRVADQALALFPGFTDVVFEQAFVASDEGDAASAAALLERCLEMGDAPSAYSATVGCGSYLALLALADVRRRQDEDAGAEALLERCLREHPRFLAAVLPFAAVRLARGAEASGLAGELEALGVELTASVRFMLATALYEAGWSAEAEPQFREILRRQPDSGPARAALAEALLSQRRYAEAAATARDLAVEGPAATAGLRTELFALLVDGDPVGAGDALGRATATGLDAAELAFFAAWLAAEAGEDLPERVLPGAAELLMVSLQALLRVEEVDAFARLVPLADRVGLPWREVRERLAGMYLHRGFLDSAADEWISVCEDAGPDARALVGLAQVAVAKGLHEDAAVFAREAAALDATHEGAARLLAALGAPAAA